MAERWLRSPRNTLAKLFGISPIRETNASWFTGSLGEIRVGQILARLSPEWTVLHSIPIGDRGSDIDHLLIGPPGVFTINTKRHKSKRVAVYEHRLLVEGQKTDHLRDALSEADRASRILSRALGVDVPVHAAVVIVGAAQVTARGRQSDAAALTDLELLRNIKRRRRTLSPDQIKRIMDVAARPQTWSALPSQALERHLLQEFRRLQAEEERARRIRVSWLALALLLLVVLVAPVVYRVFTEALLGTLTH